MGFLDSMARCYILGFSWHMARSASVGLLQLGGSLLILGVTLRHWLACTKWVTRSVWLAPEQWGSHSPGLARTPLGFSSFRARSAQTGSLVIIGSLALVSSGLLQASWLALGAWVTRHLWLALLG
jgi:hypothetical protein